MSLWLWVLGASLGCLALKLAGYLMPPQALESPRVAHTAAMVTVGLLAALVVAQAFSTGQRLTVDARLASVVVAVIALRLRAPFIVVVLLGAATAALARALL